MNVPEFVRQKFEDMWGERVFRATVTGTNGNLVLIRREGEPSADPSGYPAMASYASPTIGDEVLVTKLGKGFIVTGKITREGVEGEATDVGAIPAREWGETIGLKYVFSAHVDMKATTTGLGLSHGWIVDGGVVFSSTENASGDLGLSLTDYTPRHRAQVTANNNAFMSPAIIGDAGLLQAIQQLTGVTVNTIRTDIWSKFQTSADPGSNVQGFGVFGPDVSIPSDAKGIHFRGGATNFEVSVFGGGDQDTGIPRDTAWHKWSIIIDIGALQADFEIDDVEVVSDQALAQDKWPLRAGMTTSASISSELWMSKMIVEFSA